jgi:aspartate aminotransferase-like enzyme
MALPPGLAFGAASGRFLERAGRQSDAGFYFSVKKLVSIARESLPFSTPAVSLLVALECQVRRIAAAGGWTARWARHRSMRDTLEGWVASRREVGLMAATGQRSPAVSTIRLPAGTAHSEVLAALFALGYLVGGPLDAGHGSVLRIGHMGDLTPEHLVVLLTTLEEILS